MKTPRGCTGFHAVLLITVVEIFWGMAPARGAVLDQEGNTPRSTSGPAAPDTHREVTLEERGDIFMARKEYDNAADYYYRALRQSSSNKVGLWNKMGIAFQQESKFRDARKAYNKAIHVNSNFAEAWNNVGTVFALQKKYAKSIDYYARAIKLKDDVAAFHINLGSSYYHLKKYAEAVAEYRTALRIDPKAVNAQSSVGTVVHTGAPDVQYYYYMAKALASVGNAEEAVRYLRRALEEGFANQRRIDDDPDFKKISKDPAFVELMRNPPVAIKD